MKNIKYILLIILSIFIFIRNAKADTYNMNYEYYQQYYDNSGSSVTAVSTTWNESLQSYVSGNINTVANSYGAGLSISSPIPLLANHTYSMSIYFDNLSNISLSSKNNIAIGNSLSNASSNYVNGSYLTTMNYSSVSNNTILKFAFTTSSNGSFIFIPWTTTSTLFQSYVLTQISIDDLGSGGVSQSDIDNSLNNQTNIIQNHINDMSQDIQDSIKDNFNDCYSNLFNINDFHTEEGGGISYLAFRNNLKPNTTYTLTSDSNLTWIKISTYAGYGSDLVAYEYFNGSGFKKLTFTTNSIGSSNIYLGIGQFNNWSSLVTSISQLNNVMIVEGNSAYPYTPYGKEVCKNKIDETNDKLGDINDSINNSNTTDSTNEAGGFFNDFTTDTHGLTAIITTPLSLISSITSASCSPLVLPLPYVDKDLTLPCMSSIYSDYFGDFLTIYHIITFGIVAYWVCVRIFNLVKDFKNPDHDEIEVLDL